jgi:ER-bound oxygenase mpaB/B'/Rubber oxygenase, catalytic domain
LNWPLLSKRLLACNNPAMKIKTSRVFTDTVLNPFRTVADVPADAAVEALVRQGGMAELRNTMTFLGDAENLQTDSQSIVIQNFISENSQLPQWVDLKKMDLALTFFWKNAQQIALTLGCYSLPYCYAAADGAQVLWLSERIKNDTFKRLEETGEFLFGIMQEKDWLNKKNVIKILKIRLIHAIARYFSLHSKQWNSAWGTPVNQEDMAGTNLAFSYIALRGLRKSGVVSSEDEEEAYLHLWNIVGFLMGVNVQLLPQNLREAYQLDKAIATRHFKPSEAGRGLAKALLKTLELQTANSNPALQNFPAAQMRFLLGDDIADLLDLPKAKFETSLLKLTSDLSIFPQSLIFGNEPPSGALAKYIRN